MLTFTKRPRSGGNAELADRSRRNSKENLTQSVGSDIQSNIQPYAMLGNDVEVQRLNTNPIQMDCHFSQLEEPSPLTGSVPSQMYLVTEKQPHSKHGSEISFKPAAMRDSFTEESSKQEAKATPITFYISTSKSSISKHRKSNKGVFVGNVLVTNLQKSQERVLEPSRPTVLRGVSIPKLQRFEEKSSSPYKGTIELGSKEVVLKNEPSFSIPGIVTLSQEPAPKSSETSRHSLKVQAHQIKPQPKKSEHVNLHGKHRISVAVSSAQGSRLRSRLRESQNQDLPENWHAQHRKQDHISSAQMFTNADKGIMGPGTGDQTEDENNSGHMILVEAESEKFLAKERHSCADSESQHTTMEPMMLHTMSENMYRNSKSPYPPTHQSYITPLDQKHQSPRQVISIPTIINIDDLVCKNFIDALQGLPINGDSEISTAKRSKSNAKMSVVSNNPQQMQLHPVKVQVHEVKLKVTEMDNVRIISRAMHQGEQRRLAKKRAALMRHKSNKHQSAVRLEENSSHTASMTGQSKHRIPTKTQKSMPDCSVTQTQTSEIGKSQDLYVSSIYSENKSATQNHSDHMQRTQTHLMSKKNSINTATPSQSQLYYERQQVLHPLRPPTSESEEIISRFNQDLRPLLQAAPQHISFKEGQSTEAFESKHHTEKTDFTPVAKIRNPLVGQPHQTFKRFTEVTFPNNYLDCKDSFAQVQLSQITNETQTGPTIIVRDDESLHEPYNLEKNIEAMNQLVQDTASQASIQTPIIPGTHPSMRGKRGKPLKKNAFVQRWRSKQQRKLSTNTEAYDFVCDKLQARGSSVLIQRRLLNGKEGARAVSQHCVRPLLVYCDHLPTRVMIPRNFQSSSRATSSEEAIRGRRKSSVSPTRLDTRGSREFRPSMSPEKSEKNVFVVDSTLYNFSQWEFDQMKQRNETLMNKFHHVQVPQPEPIPIVQVSHQMRCQQTELESKLSSSQKTNAVSRNHNKNSEGLSQNKSRKSQSRTAAALNKLQEKIETSFDDRTMIARQGSSPGSMRQSFVSLYRKSGNMETLNEMISKDNTGQVGSPKMSPQRTRPLTATIVQLDASLGQMIHRQEDSNSTVLGKSVHLAADSKHRLDTQELNSQELQSLSGRHISGETMVFKGTRKTMDAIGDYTESKYKQEKPKVVDTNRFKQSTQRQSKEPPSVETSLDMFAQIDNQSQPETDVQLDLLISKKEEKIASSPMTSMHQSLGPEPLKVKEEKVASQKSTIDLKSMRRSVVNQSLINSQFAYGSNQPAEPTVLRAQKLKRTREAKKSEPRIQFVEMYRTELYRDKSSGLIDRKRMEYDHYMEHRAKQLMKLKRHQQRLESRKAVTNASQEKLQAHQLPMLEQAPSLITKLKKHQRTREPFIVNIPSQESKLHQSQEFLQDTLTKERLVTKPSLDHLDKMVIADLKSVSQTNEKISTTSHISNFPQRTRVSERVLDNGTAELIAAAHLTLNRNLRAVSSTRVEVLMKERTHSGESLGELYGTKPMAKRQIKKHHDSAGVRRRREMTEKKSQRHLWSVDLNTHQEMKRQETLKHTFADTPIGKDRDEIKIF